eukprot:TRINITY_DN62821_c0_g1_i1.p1 TRINITY_DN62821_c0_g1~~TRINITY_DN62821_c0_g1_i1.p1  ORF type:complete len:463 (-),score=42.16 TRINITY_DN62821_c0_g1_i1:196-1518(-)
MSLDAEASASLRAPDSSDAALCRREFLLLCVTFGLNHATVTTPILFASSVLTNDVGQGSNAVLYGTTLVFSLFFANLVLSYTGPRNGLALSMIAYSTYVFLFAVSASLCAHRDDNGACIEGHPLQFPASVVGAFIGGCGAGLLWTCQGAFFALVCERLAAAEATGKQVVTAELSGTWGLIFLAFECAIRALTTVLTKYVGLHFDVVFYIYAGLAALAALVFASWSTDLQKGGADTRSSICAKLTAATTLWRDPKLWLLQPTNITFGFAAAWLGGYVSRNILSQALNLGFLGFAGAMLSGLAAILSKVCGLVSERIGKGPVVAIGAIAFLMLGICSKFVGEPSTWGWGVLVFYMFMGIGRAVYESTNKAIFADMFPGAKSAGAFANVFVFNSGASTVAFILGATGTELPELYLLLFFGIVTVPGYALASWLGQRFTSRDGQ